ncbi:hypothetical protein DP939_10250 [Spongiactinospora rosea]|uniref:Thioesterase superfamily protein n=1 Tax=Spongiactinospora rosea TaxID=2248750 RepID=A0A366M3N0_9ACTN|nr:hypothetical protein [Spongiactinospora rosea]RBQ20189.1 hypothetical protein DP939_10250 [Spongiactinospora rosea]
MTAPAELRTVVSVPARYRGPETAANGGWIAAVVAEALGEAAREAPVEVTLHAPTPLDTELNLVHHGNAVTLCRDGAGLVEAIPVAEPLGEPGFVPFNEAARAEEGFAGLDGHPFPECFVCGMREPGDGLRIFPGPVPGTAGLHAAGWRVPMSVTGEDGVVPVPVVWAALDCVSGWASMREGERPLLGRLTAQVHRRVYPGGAYSVVGAPLPGAEGRDGRKLTASSAIYEADGTLVAVAKAVWILPRTAQDPQ